MRLSSLGVACCVLGLTAILLSLSALADRESANGREDPEGETISAVKVGGSQAALVGTMGASGSNVGATTTDLRVGVFDKLTKEPIHGALVRLLSRGDGRVQESLSDGGGGARFRAEGIQSARLTVVRSGYLDREFDVDVGSSAAEVRVELEGKGSLTVKVVDQSGEGLALKGARVVLKLDGRKVPGPASTDDLGRAAWKSIVSGVRGVLVVSLPGYAGETRSVQIDRDVDVVVALAPISLLRLDLEIPAHESTPMIRFTASILGVQGEASSLMETVDVVFINGRGAVEIGWEQGAQQVICRLADPFDRSRGWESRAAIEPSNVEEWQWTARVAFADMRAIKIRFLAERGGKEFPVVAQAVSFQELVSRNVGTMTTGHDGVAVVSTRGSLEGRFRFWSGHLGLVSPLTSGSDLTRNSMTVLLGSFGGDLEVHGLASSDIGELGVEEHELGSWPDNCFRNLENGGVGVHVPPGNYRLSLGSTTFGEVYAVREREVCVVHINDRLTSAIQGSVPDGIVSVQLSRSSSAVALPVPFRSAVPDSEGKFHFNGLSGGRYVVSFGESSGWRNNHAVELGQGEIKDLGQLSRDDLQELEVRLVDELGSGAAGRRLLLWEAPKSESILLRRSTDESGTVRVHLPLRNDLALFGVGWAATLERGVTSAVIRLGNPDDGPRIPFEKLVPEHNEVVLIGSEDHGPLCLIRRVDPSGTIQVPSRWARRTHLYAWDEGWGFYRVSSSSAPRPQALRLPPDKIPRGTNRCRITLVSAGGMNLAPLSWNRQYRVGTSVFESGLQIHAAPGWVLRLEFFGGADRAILVKTLEDGLDVQQIK